MTSNYICQRVGFAESTAKHAQALANTRFTTNGRWEQHIGWSLEKIQSRAVEQLDILAAALDALVDIPDLFDFFRD